jgi:predicted amidohydrolase
VAVFLFLLLALPVAAEALRAVSFAPGDGGWSVWSARPETKPRAWLDSSVDRSAGGSLALSGNSNAAAHGGWLRKVDGIEPGAWYRFTAYYRAEGVAAENWQVVPRLDWRDANGKRAGQPEYANRSQRDGQWTRVTMAVPAPDKAASAQIQLYLSNSPLGTVWWDDISIERIPAPGPRQVRVAAINLRPRNTGSPEESVRQFIAAIDKSVTSPVDVILLPEGITVVGTAKTYVEVADTLPDGPTVRALSEAARRKKAYIAGGIYEREGHVVYNTSVLLDRAGALAGKYRKVYLPREEVEHGLTPGGSYPVFTTDFGRVGMMICYDVFFPDPARGLAANGAEMILMPIWGGDETLAKARAIENKVFLVASGYDHPTYIMDPDGERLSEAREQGAAAIATIDLNRRYTHSHLGDMHSRRMREIRLDVPIVYPGLEK